MIIRGILFDMYGTLIDVNTDETSDSLYSAIAHFLTYQGIQISGQALREEYFALMKQQKNASGEKHGEFDAVALWRSFLAAKTPKGITAAKLKLLPLVLAEMFRGVSRYRLALYPEVLAVMSELQARFPMAAVSDAQSAWLWPEMRALGLESFFKYVAVSSDYGFRKPDARLFEKALAALRLEPSQVLFVGNDMFRDISGAKQLGIKTVFFSSNQGRKSVEGVAPDYIIYNFWELRAAIEFFERE